MTKAQATKQAKATLKLMPAGWRINVWLCYASSNSYDWCLSYASGMISVYPSTQHQCGYFARADMSRFYVASHENWGQSDTFDHPQKAVENILERIHVKIDRSGNFAKTVRKAAGLP